MATEVFGNGRLYAGGYNLTTARTSLGLTLAQAVVESNCMQADEEGTAKFMQEWLLGLKSFDMSYSGYTDSDTGTVDSAVFATFGTAGTIITMCGATGASGDPAYSAYATNAQHQDIDGSVGGMSGYAGAAFGEGTACFRGTVLGVGEKSATGNGTIYQLGAITAGTNALYAALHVTASSGADRSMVVDLYSAAAAGFSSPTKRVTFSTVGGTVTSEIKSLATSVTDTYWRATWTLDGTTPKFTIMLNVGIIKL